MKKLVTLLLIPLLLLTLAPTVFATSMIAREDVVSLASDETIEGNFYAAGEIVEISGTVTGDAYVFGGQVVVSGEIQGDLITAGGTINMSGSVGQDARIAGGQISLSGPIGKNLSVAGGNIDILSTASVAGAAQIAGGNVTISAPIANELLLGVGNATLNNDIGGNVQAGAGTLRLGSNANLASDLTYWSEEEASIDNNAQVQGAVNRQDINAPNVEAPTQEQVAGFLTGVNIYSKLSSIIATLILGILLVKLFPNYSQNASEIFADKYLRSLGIGFLGIIIFPFVVVLLVATLVGIPFALMLIPVYIAYLFLARIYGMIAIGKYLSKKAGLKNTLNLNFTIGIIAYYVLTTIPILGGLIKLLIVIAAFGAAMINDKNCYQACRKAKIA